MGQGGNRFHALAVNEAPSQRAAPVDGSTSIHASIVRVDAQNLVQQTLSRYPVDFAALRELIQNADDSGATQVRVSM